VTISLTFHGAARTVTGSCFLVDHPRGRVLVDCGLFQGSKTLQELNYGRFAFDPTTIDRLLVTHAHIDHTGLVPKLCRLGFRGPIIATEASCDLMGFMLPDSGAIQESEVERLNERNRRRGRPAVEPIYTAADAEACLKQLQPVGYDHWIPVMPHVRARFWNAGHILGSASIELEIIEKDGEPPISILFSGDVGPDEKTFHDDPSGPSGIDHLVVESTYGDRDREDVTLAAREERLRQEVRDALAAGGVLLIPAFAVERTQELLYAIGRLIEAGKLPQIPVFIDSPLAHRATRAFAAHASALDGKDARRLFEAPWIRFTESVADSKALERVHSHAIIMAASGMCEAGRIRFHLKDRLWRPETTVLFVGYQAAGTLGRLIRDGERRVRIFGEEVEVKARIRSIESFSAHADQQELVTWVKARLPVRRTIFETHGEPAAMQRLRDELAKAGLDPARIVAPELGQRFDLSARAATVAHPVVTPPVPSDAIGWDWHNRYAKLLLDLGETLRALPDDGARRELLDRLATTLGRSAAPAAPRDGPPGRFSRGDG
jgi:metallo-beta-lactamase family protein